MKLDYALTLEVYEAALGLHRRQKTSRRLIFAAWYFGLPGVSVLGLIFVVFLRGSEWVNYLSRFVWIDIWLLLISISMPIFRYYSIRWRFERLFPPSRPERERSIDIDDERIMSGIPGISEVKLFWKAIIDFAQDDKVTLLYIHKRAFLSFPTSLLSPDQRTELNDLVARYVTRKRS